MRLFPLPVLLGLAGCGLVGGDFPALAPRPGEVPRAISAPGDAEAASLSDAERGQLDALLARETAALNALRADLAVAERALADALAAARGTAMGSDRWAQAQLYLSRYDQARAPAADMDGRLAPARLMVDSLPEDHPDRRRVDVLSAEIAALVASAARTAATADQALAPRAA